MTKSEIKNIVEIAALIAFVCFVLFTETGSGLALEAADCFFEKLFNLV